MEAFKHNRKDLMPDLEDLMRQYPWFSREEILEAIAVKQNRNKVQAYLDVKSGSWTFVESFEF